MVLLKLIENIYWFKAKKNQIFRLNRDILFGIVFVPPDNSSYCIHDPINEIESEFLNLSSNYDICLGGDFDSRATEISDIPIIQYDAYQKC